MIKAVSNEQIERRAIVMLNITGGGEKQFKLEHELHYKTTDLILDNSEDVSFLITSAKSLF